MSIKIENIDKSFGAFSALRDINLEVRRGEFLALLGPSGSGKTTLLRILAGLEFPESGSVRFDGKDVTRLKVADRHVGFVFQHYALFKHMTVAENVAFGLTVKKRRDRPSRAAIKARAQELLELVQLGHVGHRYPAQLSGGQRQRVALARALAVEPKLLLLDEPFGALDAKVRKELRVWLRGLHEQMGLTSIFVTHDQEEALELADRVVVMDHGVIEQIDRPENIYDAPTSAFVSDFVGETNRIPVVIAEGRVTFMDQTLNIKATGKAEGAAELHFRPHDGIWVESGPGTIPMLVCQTRPRNGGWRIEGRVAGVETLVEIDIPRGLDAPQAGTHIAVKPARAHVFSRLQETTA